MRTFVLEIEWPGQYHLPSGGPCFLRQDKQVEPASDSGRASIRGCADFQESLSPCRQQSVNGQTLFSAGSTSWRVSTGLDRPTFSPSSMRAWHSTKKRRVPPGALRPGG